MSTDLVKFDDGPFVCSEDTTYREKERQTDRHAKRHGGDNSIVFPFKFWLRLLQNMGES